ncbi:Phosphoribosyl transferase domain-containing protein [Cyclobacterium lianum]|uniref:Phosphoribosyl transferase domain-containing protein n=1 Tax=Cyclobacterium lianum TaxID=388280 RepID=A0A1M7M3D6_9BACT|nr:phosphoribosyltransferase family protein [Cyclobacterium lianum]SHM85063.1 Phosphoribosyl transferase domain-containing protein [Cyclobacterium lianum]
MFEDRKDAAEKLARALERYRSRKTLVLGIPRGGAETAYYVARHLDAEMSLVITRKLGYPGNPEAAFGAVAEDGSFYISEMASEVLSADTINEDQPKK